MKTIAKLFTAARKLFNGRYDVPVDHTYSKQSMAAQSAVQDAALFLAERTQKPVGVYDNESISVISPGAPTSLS